MRSTICLFGAIVLIFVSCGRDSNFITSDSDSEFRLMTTVSRTISHEAQVVAYVNWTIDHVVPLLKDSAVYNAIVTGNTNAPIVVSKLQLVGFDNYEDFESEHQQKLSEFQNAVVLGQIGQNELLSIISSNFTVEDFNFFEGGDIPEQFSALPCYNNFLLDMAGVLVATALSAETGPGAIVTAVAGTAIAYAKFKLCVSSTYGG